MPQRVLAQHSFHDLRHTFAVQQYLARKAKGDAEPWKVIAALLGHKSWKTTMDCYLASVSISEAELSDVMTDYFHRILSLDGKPDDFKYEAPAVGSSSPRRGKMNHGFLLEVPTVLSAETAAVPTRQAPEDTDAQVRLPASSVAAPTPVVPLTGVRTGTDALTGKPFLHIVIRDKHGSLLPPYVLDNWCRFGEIGLAFAEALYGKGTGPVSIYATIRELRTFFAWLTLEFPHETPTRLADLTTERLIRFRSHLDTLKDKAGHPAADDTKRKRLGELRALFTWMQRNSPNKWKPKLAPKLRFPSGIWTGTSRRTQPRDIIPDDALHAILKAAAAEVERAIRRMEEGAALIEAGRPRLRTPSEMKRADFYDIAVALAAVQDWWGGYVKNIGEVKAKHRGLGYSIQVDHRIGEFLSYLYPGARELVPFIVLLTVHTAYNPETIPGLELNHIEMNDIFPDQFGFDLPERRNGRAKADGAGDEDGEAGEGATRLRTKATKARARGKPQNRSFRIDPDDRFGAYLLIQNVKAMTERIRPQAAPKNRDRLFIFHQMQRDVGVRAFGTGKHGISSDMLWQYVLRRFIAENDLPNFNLAALRGTMGDIAERQTGDIRAVQLLLGHSGADVTFLHYLSAGARRRAAEAVGTVQGLRQRWV